MSIYKDKTLLSIAILSVMDAPFVGKTNVDGTKGISILYGNELSVQPPREF